MSTRAGHLHELERQIHRTTPQGFDFVASLPNPGLATQEEKVAGALVGYADANST